MPKVFVIDDESSILETLDLYLSGEGYEVAALNDVVRGIERIREERPDLLIMDIRMPKMSGLDALEKIKSEHPDLFVIMMTAHDDMQNAIRSIQLGAFEFVSKPIDIHELSAAIERALELKKVQRGPGAAEPDEAEDVKLGNIVGRTRPMVEIFKTIGAVANSNITVLVQGESGTGKELIAKAIHFNGSYRARPFVAVSCSALAETLLESELFGHVKGAFTGAVAEKKGKFEVAGEGTLFLDEIGDVSPSTQVKLLRVLQEREFERVGSNATIRTNMRVIAATNRDLKTLVEQGRFRDDLYYRLKVVSIHVPPLRERKEDIPLLVEHLIRRVNRKLGRSVRGVSARAMDKLVAYEWPGNVREVENVLTKAIVLSKSDVIIEENLALDVPAGEPREVARPPEPAAVEEPLPESLSGLKTLDEMEMSYIRKVLALAGGNKRRACRILGISRPTLDRKLSRYRIGEFQGE